MRNKFSSNLLQKGLISLAAASVLATGAMALNVSTTTKDFDLSVSNTSVAKGDATYLTITLLNENGVVDTVNGGAATLKVKVSALQADLNSSRDDNGLPSPDVNGDNSQLTGDLTTSNTTGASQVYFKNGVAVVTLDYDGSKITTDTISVIISAYGTDIDSGSSLTQVIGTKYTNVEVTQPANQSEALAIAEINPLVSDTDNTDGTYTAAAFLDGAESDTETVVKANSGVRVTVKAYTDEADADTASGTATFTENQNSEVTLKLVTTDDAYTANSTTNYTKDSTESITTKEFTGTMTNGVATIDIPASDLQEAGVYRLYASTPTTKKTRNSDYTSETRDLARLYTTGEVNSTVDDENAAKAFYVSPLSPVSLDISVDKTNILAKGISTFTQSTLTAGLVDEFGNNAKSAGEAVTIKITNSADLYIFGAAKEDSATEISASGRSTTYAITGYTGTDTDKVSLGSTGKTTTTLTVTATPSSYGSAEIDLDVYKYALVLNTDMNVSDTASTPLSSVATAGATPSTGDVVEAQTSIQAFIISGVDVNNSYYMDGIPGNEENTTASLDSAIAGAVNGRVTTATTDVWQYDLNMTAKNSQNFWAGDVNLTDLYFLNDNNVKFTISLHDYNTSSGEVVDTMTGAQVIGEPTSNNFGDVNSLVKFTFDKAVDGYDNGAYVTAEVTSVDGSLEIMPFEAIDANITVNSANAKKMTLGKYHQADTLFGVDAYIDDLSSVTVTNSSTSTTDANLTIYGPSSSNDLTNKLDITDTYGNSAKLKNLIGLKFTSTSVTGELSPASVMEGNTTGTDWGTDNNFTANAMDSSDYYILASGGVSVNNDFNSTVINYSSLGNDNLNFVLTGGFATEDKTIAITVSETDADLDTLTFTGSQDTVLKNSVSAYTINAFKADNTAWDFDSTTNNKLYVFVSDPNKVTLRTTGTDAGDSAVDGILENGASLEASSGNTQSILFFAQNESGAVTLTLKNASGSISSSRTINIVDSSADLPSPISEIAVDGATSLVTNSTSTLTITVTKESGEVAANKTVSLESDNTDVLTVPTSVTTDDNGNATITITSQNIVSSSNLKITADELTKTVVINVGEAPSMTIGSTEATVQIGNQTTVDVSNNEGTPTVTSSDTAIATASYSGGSVIITGVVDGTATITVTDTDGTVQTIAVTVEAAVIPADLTDTTKVTDNAGVINADGQIVMSDAEAVISFLNAFNSDDTTLAMNTAVAGLEATTLGTTTFFKENGKSIFAINYSTSNGATTITISWLDTVTARAVEPDYVVTITDGDQTLELPIVKGASTPTETAGTPALVAGWNLLGNASNASQTVAKTGISITWAFVDSTWTQDGDVPAGQGFWAKADADIAGYEFANSGDGTSMPTFSAGTWSLMAATMSETLADVLASKTDATVVWSFTDSTWSSDGATTIEVGQGYWVK